MDVEGQWPVAYKHSVNVSTCFYAFCQNVCETWMMAQSVSLGRVFISPNSDKRIKRSPGAKSITFIFTDTARLSTLQNLQRLQNFKHIHNHCKRWWIQSWHVTLYIFKSHAKLGLYVPIIFYPEIHLSIQLYPCLCPFTYRGHSPGSSVHPEWGWLLQTAASWPQGH